MKRVALFPAARRDLGDIWSYIAEHNVDAADEMIGRFRYAMQLLADRPYAGVDATSLRPGLRKWIVGRYILFYLVQTDAIQVVRILHSARNIGTLDLN